MDIYEQAATLAAFYDRSPRTAALPWRIGAAPHLQVLVEGALARTHAEAVARRFGALFRDITTAQQWLSLDPRVRLRRCRTLGLGRQKADLIDGLAHALNGASFGTCYAHSMAVLRMGGRAYPVDGNVERVAGRLGHEPRSWLEQLLAVVDDDPRGHVPHDRPPGYRIVSALLDVGALYCVAGPARCDGCPLRVTCPTAPAERRSAWPHGIVACQRCHRGPDDVAYRARGLCWPCYRSLDSAGQLDDWSCVERPSRRSALHRVVREVGMPTVLAALHRSGFERATSADVTVLPTPGDEEDELLGPEDWGDVLDDLEVRINDPQQRAKLLEPCPPDHPTERSLNPAWPIAW